MGHRQFQGARPISPEQRLVDRSQNLSAASLSDYDGIGGFWNEDEFDEDAMTV